MGVINLWFRELSQLHWLEDFHFYFPFILPFLLPFLLPKVKPYTLYIILYSSPMIPSLSEEVKLIAIARNEFESEFWLGDIADYLDAIHRL